jgi:isocitrate dehydrogenase kinase/phosphatase
MKPMLALSALFVTHCTMTAESLTEQRKATDDLRNKIKESLLTNVNKLAYRKNGSRVHTFFSKLCCNKVKKESLNQPILYTITKSIQEKNQMQRTCTSI